MRYKVLLVDDEPLIVKNLKQTIPWDQLRCQLIGEARNGKRALEVCEQQMPDLVITDIRMPKVDGMELIENLRNMSEGRYFPTVIILSGYDDFTYAQQAIRLGAFDFLLKPIDYDELQQVIMKAQRQIDSSHALKDAHIKNVLYEGLLNEQAMDFQKFMSMDKYYYLLLVAESRAKGGGQAFETLEQSARSLLIEQEELYLLRLNPEQSVFVFMHPSQDVVTRLRITLLESVQHWAEMEQLTFGLSEVVRWQELHKAYLQAETFASLEVKTRDYFRNSDSLEKATFLARKVKVFIDEHFDEELCLEGVAEHFEVSVSYLSPLFKKYTGMTFLKYLTSQRVKKAKLLLEQTPLKAGEIAEMIGYQDARYFSQVFKQWTGMTPSDYRKQHGNLL